MPDFTIIGKLDTDGVTYYKIAQDKEYVANPCDEDNEARASTTTD